ncbi:MAG: GDP-mannose 4,6-dehydratase [Candidatus Marinimicrobia bacterium]|nr:GDP-mannose 4,6-dehydratase [Candidatus Neomarinimicrobiota bacterium]
MKIVITGSHGFMGKKLVQTLILEGHDICCVDLATGYDVAEWDSVKDLHDFDVIIHLAAITYVPQSFELPREMYRVNINGTLNMLELCRINKAKMIFNSSYVYGKPQYLPIDEKHAVSSHNPYCQSKIIGENLCESYYRDFQVPIMIFRIFNAYGEGHASHFLIPNILQQMRQKQEIVLENPIPRRDYIHIRDILKAYQKAIDYQASNYEIFNIGTGMSHSAKDVAEIMLKASPIKTKLSFSGKERVNEVLDTVADIGKIRKLLKWEPKISLEQGLTELVKA